MIILNLINKSKIPLYIQIYAEIKKLIQSKILKANEKLPSKKDFMDYYNLSQNTIQNALYLLLEEGYIFSIERKGYFISDIENLIVHDVKIENIAVKYVVDKNTYLASSSLISFDFEMQGMKISMEMDTKMTNINNVTDIVVPDEVKNVITL